MKWLEKNLKGVFLVKLINLEIKNHKVLRDFYLEFKDTSSHINYIIGNNGSGKSTIFEVLLDIFKCVILTEKASFDFKLEYSIYDKQVSIYGLTSQKLNFSNGFSIEHDLPRNIVIYYSGISKTIDTICEPIENQFVSKIKKSFFIPRVLFNIKNRHFDYILIALLSQESIESLTVNSDVSPVNVLGLLKDKTNIVSLNSLSITIHEKNNLQGVTREFFEKLNGCATNINKINSREKELVFNNEALRDFRSQLGLDRDVLKAFDILYFADVIVAMDLQLNMEYGDIGNLTQAVINASQLSEGEKQTCIIIGISEFFGYKETLYLFDEPDSFLHPSWQLDFNSRLLELNTTQHFLITTHSPTLISRVRKENVFLIDKGNIIETPHTFGRDFSSIIEEVMGVDEKNPITAPLFDEFYELIEYEKFKEAEEILLKLTEYMGSEDKQIFRARSILEYERN